MNYPFKEILILYNPNSTGDSVDNAKSLKKDLDNGLSGVKTTLLETKYAGYAEKIGHDYAKKNQPVLLVSSSGDGGYNELVNGVMSVSEHSNVAICVLPSGNANDHYHAVNYTAVSKRIIAGKTKNIDILQISAMKDSKQWSRYAHSYIGMGLTAYIGKKLTEADLNPVNEKWLVLKYLVLFRHVTLRELPNGKYHHFSSIVISNIDRMSKVIKLSQDARLDDGKLELYETHATSPFSHWVALIIGSTLGMKPERQITSINLESKYPIEVQCDGEVVTIDADEPITMMLANQKILSIV